MPFFASIGLGTEEQKNLKGQFPKPDEKISVDEAR
jgi:hypothetical protein